MSEVFIVLRARGRTAPKELHSAWHSRKAAEREADKLRTSHLSTWDGSTVWVERLPVGRVPGPEDSDGD